MFTGLIEAVGELTTRRATPGGEHIRVAAALAPDLTPGDSLAVNGVCLTVTCGDADAFEADVGPETLRVTTLGRLAPGALVNLERPLAMGARVGGHLVQGHVDTVGRIARRWADADFEWFTIAFPAELAPSIIEKGSIAIDGISLTVARLGGDVFDVQIVPFTLEHTNLKAARTGDPVNLESDLVGKYVIRAATLAGLSMVDGSLKR